MNPSSTSPTPSPIDSPVQSPHGTHYIPNYAPPPPITREPETFVVRRTTPEEELACLVAISRLSTDIIRVPDQLSVSWHRSHPCDLQFCMLHREPSASFFTENQFTHQRQCRFFGLNGIWQLPCCSYRLLLQSRTFGETLRPVREFTKRRQGELKQRIYDEMAWRHGIYQRFVARQPFIGFTQPRLQHAMTFSIICPYAVSPFHCHLGDRDLMNEADGEEGTPCLALFTRPDDGLSEVDVLRSYFSHVDFYHTTGEYIDEEPHNVREPQYYRKWTNIVNEDRFFDNPFVPLDLSQFRDTVTKLTLECRPSRLQQRLGFLFDEETQKVFDVIIRTRLTVDELIGKDWMSRVPGVPPAGFDLTRDLGRAVTFTVGNRRT